MKWLRRPARAAEQEHSAARPEVRTRGGLPGLLQRAGNAAAARLLGRGQGRPLDPAVRAALERGFGADLGAVRLHTDPAAQQAAGALDARAVTSGNDVLLGADAPAA